MGNSEPVMNEDIQIKEMLAGVTYQGFKIKEVISKGFDFIVYTTVDHDGISYRYTNSDFSEPISRLEGVLHEAFIKFKGERSNYFITLEASAARQIFNKCPPDVLDRILSEIKTKIAQLPAVETIIGRDKEYSVWQDENGEIDYRIKKTTPETARAISEYVRINSLSSDLLPLGERKGFNRRLGAALNAAFKLNSDSSETFANLELLVIAAMQGEVKLKLLVITVGVALFLIISAIAAYYFLPLPNFVRLCTISGTGGLAGALISFLERSKTSSIGEGDLGWYVILSNVCRVIIGGIFGVIAFTASNADIAFSLFKASKPALLLLGIAAGFSERLIPDVLGTIASSKEIDKDPERKDTRS